MKTCNTHTSVRAQEGRSASLKQNLIFGPMSDILLSLVLKCKKWKPKEGMKDLIAITTSNLKRKVIVCIINIGGQN